MSEKSLQGKEPAKCTYDLIGVINHYGTMNAGHYTAHCLNSETDRWYRFDDSMCREIKPEEIVTSAAYVLFYRSRFA